MSSMVWDAYESGITTSLGGGYVGDSYSDDYYEEDDSDSSEKIKFEIGDTVKLNSGGTLMTVKIIDNNTITCRWFDKSDSLQSESFNTFEIEIINKSKGTQESITDNIIPTIDIDNDEIPF